MTTHRGALVLLVVLAAAQLVQGARYVERTSFVHDGQRVFTLWDDAMISMQYARNLRRGHGLVWNPGGDRVQGFSNPAVTLVMAGIHLLPLPPERTALAFQGLALLVWTGLPPLAWLLARRVHPGRPAVAAATAVATAACAPLAIWSLQGSDVPFVTLWLLALAAAVSGPSLRTAPWLAGLALGPWIRPDVLVYAPFLLAAAHRLHGGGGRVLAAGVGAVAASLAGYLAFGWLYYGDPLPNTWYLKATGSPRSLVLLSGAGELVAWAPYLALAVGLAGVALWQGRDRPRVWLCAALFCVSQAYNTWVGGDFVFGYGSRFAVPGLVFLLLLAVAGADALGRRAVATPPAAALVVFAAFLAWLSSPPSASREWFAWEGPTMLRRENASNYHYAAYLAEHTEPTITLGAYWGGVPPYFSGRPAIDLLGKSDRHIARLSVDRFLPGHSKWDWDYVLDLRRPDVIRAPSRGLGRRPDFRSAYLRVRTPSGLTFHLRRDAVSKLRDPQAVLVDPRTGRRLRPRRR